MNESSNILSTEVKSAVNLIRTAILQSQERAVKAVNQEQLALYYGIGRFISANTRNKNWGKGVIEGISKQLRLELPGLRGFSARNLKNMRSFYEAWDRLEPNSAVITAELPETAKIEENTIRQLQLANLESFPLVEFLSISFTLHIAIITGVKEYDERIFYIKYCNNYKPSVEDLERILKQDLYHHQGSLPNNFMQTIPDYKQAFRTYRVIRLFGSMSLATTLR